MKISDPRPVGRTAAARRTASAATTAEAGGPSASAPVRSVSDVASFLGIPAAELTMSVRDGIARLIAEVERLRRDLEDKDRRIAYLERLADEDPLAPVLNRRAFVRELSRMMAFAERYGAVSSVLYFDVNGMKRINDTYGHGAGDAALGHVATILVDNVRRSDSVGRLGGDEFGVLLAQANETVAQIKGAELATRIAETPFFWEGQQLHVEAAVGAFAFQGGEPTEILDRADREMYKHKRLTRQGRSN